MKKHLLLSLMLSVGFLYGQISISPNPWSVNSNTITITYGPDYALWDPMGENTIYMYSGVETLNDTGATWDYHDNWDDTATMTPLTLDSSTGIYTETLDFTSHAYIQEADPANVAPLAAGTQVFEFYFLLRNLDGSSQSSDLLGSNYGFQVSTLSVEDINSAKLNEISVINGVLYNPQSIMGRFTIYNINGQKIKELNSNGQSGIPLNLSQGVYLIVSEKGESKKFIVR